VGPPQVLHFAIEHPGNLDMTMANSEILRRTDGHNMTIHPSGTLPFMIAVWGALVSLMYFEVFDVSEVMKIGQYNLHSMDVAVIASVPAIIQAIRKMVLRSYTQYIMLALIFVILMSLFRGFIEHGLFATSWAFRGKAFFFISLFIFSAIPLESTLSTKIIKAFIVTGWVLVALAIMRITLGMDFLKISGNLHNPRVLQAPGALMLGQTAIILLALACSLHLPRKTVRNCLILFLLIVIFSGQRTATIATLVSLCTVLTIIKSRYRNIVRLLLLSFILATLVVTIAVILEIGWQNSLSAMPQSIQGMFGDNSTFRFRQSIWRAVIEQFLNFSIFDQLFGVSIGSRFVWFLKEFYRTFEFSVHSHYVYTFLYSGFIGFGLTVTVWLFSITRNIFRNEAIPQLLNLPPVVFAALIVSQILFSGSYFLGAEQGVILGLALATSRSV
jgi:hypothetical protein